VLDGRVILVAGDQLGLADYLRGFGATVTTDTERGMDALVYVPEPPSPGPLTDLDDAAWDAACEGVIRRALATCRLAVPQLRARRGAIVLVTPTIGLVGEPAYVAFATALEGMRALAKSAARQWGEDAITVNCVAPPLALFGAKVFPSVEPPALGHSATVADLAATIAFLVSDAGHAITGATIPVDGGVVMTP
jgi:3-oxoacyl-[acyl-carrier protein] reductase